ncbi:MAG: hypothetical protein ACI4JJ_04805 [Huintestinicola sp.]
MDKINMLTTLAYVKTMNALDRLSAKKNEIVSDERGLSGIVVTLILIGIAALAAVVFKQQIADFMASVFGKANDMLSDMPSASSGN